MKLTQKIFKEQNKSLVLAGSFRKNLTSSLINAAEACKSLQWCTCTGNEILGHEDEITPIDGTH
jgi:hypothetical protein